MIEYNVRMGDPEAEVILPRIKTDILQLFQAVASNTLIDEKLEIDQNTAVTVFLASGGYPGSYNKGYEIKNLEKITDSIIYHAGTTYKNGKVITNGGRVLAVTSFGENIQQALAKSYASAEIIDFKGKYYRSDIGFDL